MCEIIDNYKQFENWLNYKEHLYLNNDIKYEQKSGQNFLNYNMFKTKVLIICSHFDDEVIGCSSILCNKDYDVTVLVVFGDDCRKYISKQISYENKIKYKSLNYVPFSETYEPQFNNEIHQIIKEINPEIVYTHCKDNHIDHIKVSKAVDISLKLNRKNSVKKLYHFNIESTDFTGNIYKKIEKISKLKLLNYYKKYINEFHYEFILNNNDYNSKLIGLDSEKYLCEKFNLIFDKDIM